MKQLNMSAKVLSSSENLPVSTTAQQEAAAMEPPAKQPRLQQPACSFKVKLLSEHAKAPQRGSAAAAGYDLFRLVVTINFEQHLNEKLGVAAVQAC